MGGVKQLLSASCHNRFHPESLSVTGIVSACSEGGNKVPLTERFLNNRRRSLAALELRVPADRGLRGGSLLGWRTATSLRILGEGGRGNSSGSLL